MKKADIGMIGLAVMGENLVMNMASKGFSVAAYDIDQSRVKDFSLGRAKGKSIIPCVDLESFINSIQKPRKIMMMIRAGKPVDSVIDQLIPLLDQGDIIIDGGNSHYPDTIRRAAYVESKGLYFVGSGVSGGEEGALNGPSLMPGGSKEAWKHIKPIFEKIAADVNGLPCATWIGSSGSGHFVKMVHNGIEYGDIQLIAEIYHFMKDVLLLSHDEMSEIFKAWNKTELDSYLIDITGDILAFKDKDGKPLVTKILDSAGQKGTGKWTAITSLEENVALSLITEAVYARIMSAKKEERMLASTYFPKEEVQFKGSKQDMVDTLKQALYAAKIVSYAQGFDLMMVAGKAYHWELDFSEIARIWKGGCIIRSAFLGNIQEAYLKDPSLVNLMLDPFFKAELIKLIPAWRNVLATAVMHGIPMPALSSALNYFDTYRSKTLPANLTQAQRDYFGAHTYERIDEPRGAFFHTDWTGHGGDTSSTTYNT
ncbi:MAG: phosphogluconate dehydrogenase (NADP(+)-dependent, decarboxylating) [Tenericutes bacterium GWC2_34_14]|nr:MAG: phosphogluconate dehydrogenase (NADP(+)-dependent, decarboxylating) [Tenericutes bacterium GWC2_34_14]OHE34767.1 MAG: phosphogluconate dehydrogenase (NADP(+)-dependent, decarboxylating) [Tenericutes bacterium GWE2_34_108]OHE37372.1 MAG: phosphogluconate dehydrogenase (NADP(+)-dependent, decarboxylating) [Tenericutes bacterium GWF1_35_14]OHE39495.1 MAG: phosphogluconate dehydrogenase (NADP(+)-dependent, decarboxylating) [Tenericutes bacterium GWF2_35_184]OHE42578.1 MAG: phosphogluconate 